MKKTINHMLKQLDNIHETVFVRWKNYCGMTKYYQRCQVFQIVIDRASGGMRQAFHRWLNNYKESKAGLEHAYMLKMVTKMQSIFVKRAHRCFNPPIVIKDADAIMTKTV